MENLQIGTYGWQHDSWVGGFYPDDIPDDWQLDYFSNAYRVVLVPENVWIHWTEDDCESALDAVEGDFGFYFEVVDDFGSAKKQRLMAVLDTLSDIAKGVVMFSESEGCDAQCCGLPVTLVSQSQVLSGWEWKEQDVTCSGEPCGVLLELTNQPKKQAALLRSFMASLPSGYEGAPLIVKTNEIDMEQVYSLKTIGEFLGY